MRNLLLTLKYDGTDYHGWQMQDNAITVQKVLQDAIFAVTSERVSVTGCSRTDAGVHANMFCCNFKTDSLIPCGNFIFALNSQLPDDIAVIGCEEREENFNARFDCKRKQYLYKIYCSKTRDPFMQKYSLHYKYPINVDLMNEAVEKIVGKRDFAAFCAAGGNSVSTVREIFKAEFSKEGDLITFSIEGDGFLYNMVRIIVGTMLYVSQGKISVDEIEEILKSGNREAAGPTVPPNGLFLNRVDY